jgi:membrane protease YdiL (CAAX protease family)
MLIILLERTDWRLFLELTSPFKGMIVGLLIGLLLIACFYLLDRIFARNNHPPFLIFNLALLNAVIVAPLVEEIVFRGFYLRKLMLNGRGFWIANAITTGFFVSMHLPGWYFQGKLHATAQLVPIVSLAFFSFVMGLVKVSTRSLYATIVIHALNNLYIS